MIWYLTSSCHEYHLELDLTAPVSASLSMQCARMQDESKPQPFLKKLSTELNLLLPQTIDWDLNEPTSAQVSYAIEIARLRSETVPLNALRSRGDLQRYIERQLSIGVT